MKKFMLLTAVVLSLCVLNVKAATLPEVTDHEKVTVYIFRGHGCSHCYDAIEYLYNNASKYSDYMTVKTYEVWYNSNNNTLMQNVATEKEEEVGGVPYIVVGNKYSVNGFGNDTGKEIINAALEAYQSNSYIDIVAKISKSTKSEAISESLEEAAKNEGITADPNPSSDDAGIGTTSSKNNSSDIYIIGGIFLVIIGGIVALVISNNKKAK